MENELKPCEVCGESFAPDGRRKARCSRAHYVSCSQCGEEFSLSASQKVSQTFCSKGCRAKSTRRKIDCSVCGNPVEGRRKTCSTQCASQLRKATNEKINVRELNCKHCGAKYLSSNPSSRYCASDHHNNCVVCGEQFLVPPGSKRKSCSAKCSGALVNSEEANTKRAETNLKKYGVAQPFQNDAVKAQIKETNLRKLGVEYPMQSKEIRNKSKKTMADRYGVENPAHIESSIAKREETNRKRYGAENPFGSMEVKKKIKLGFLESLGVDHPMKDASIVESMVKTNLERYGVPNVLMVPEIKARAQETFSKNANLGLFTSPKISKLNLKFSSYLSERFDVEVHLEKRVDPFSYDLYIESRTLLIDLNPTVSHNSTKAFQCYRSGCAQPCDSHNPQARDYHYKRAMAALGAGFGLVQIYDWDSPLGMEKFLSGKIEKGFSRYSARKLEMREIPQRVANAWLSREHIQGAARKQTYCLGLYAGEDLLAVATFGPGRYNKNHQWEFIRYAVKEKTMVYGAPNRMFQKFLEDVAPQNVVSYIDFNHTTKPKIFLSSLGFSEQKPTGPALVWSKGKNKISNNSLLALGADRLLGTSYGRAEECGHNNEQIMLREGWLKVYTAGNRIFLWNKSDSLPNNQLPVEQRTM